MSNYVFRSGQPNEQKTYTHKICTACKCDDCHNKPKVESTIKIHPNKDKTKPPWVIHKTIVTDIKPLSYYEKAVQNIDEE